RFQTGDQRITAAVKDDARALAAQARHPVGEGFRAYAGWQTAADAHHVELAQPGQRIVNKTLPVRRRHFKAREVQIGHFPVFLRQFDVDTGTALNNLETVSNAQLAEQLLETILVIFTEESPHGDIDTAILEHLRDVNPFARSMQASGTHEVYFDALNLL